MGIDHKDVPLTNLWLWKVGDTADMPTRGKDEKMNNGRIGHVLT